MFIIVTNEGVFAWDILAQRWIPFEEYEGSDA